MLDNLGLQLKQLNQNLMKKLNEKIQSNFVSEIKNIRSSSPIASARLQHKRSPSMVHSDDGGRKDTLISGISEEERDMDVEIPES